MATTTNFGWETPDDTDLVKDGAAAIRTLGSAIDTSLVDLKGGTTGQVLSKTSNTDMDFTWVTSDDANAIQNAIVDAKGDLIAASAADTPARLAVGNNGETLVADSSTSTGLRWQGNYAAGKNKIINGDFAINQRAFTSTTTSNTYGFDRFALAASDGTVTYSAQTFTLGSAPVAGYEAINFAQVVTSGQTLTSAIANLFQKIEDVRTFAGQTITVSFWAKAASGTPNIAVNCVQNFGTGGSPSASVNTSSATQAISTNWARYSFTLAIPSVSGKTIGTTAGTNFFGVQIWFSGGTATVNPGSIGIQSGTFQIWGVQVEAGNVATAFQTATGTLAGELQACQRYYWRVNVNSTNTTTGLYGSAYSTTAAAPGRGSPVTMRVAPTSIDFSNLQLNDFAGTFAVTNIALWSGSSTDTFYVLATGATGLTTGRSYGLTANGTGFLGFNAEL